ncbi:hypothetical protein DPMN_110223 [Dreissena polymorpha]|uniref:Uncharacterized protein n=1 Tax=Dreissena polymorpha TaxID=45954 RepID=A0A9D4KCK6_DREPO|nr:hypothetical protein DPMN_110223 [Dreissena polymorpha]
MKKIKKSVQHGDKGATNVGGGIIFKKKCKKINAVEECEALPDDEFWFKVVESDRRSKVKAKLRINELEVSFQIDKGAEIYTIQQRFVKKHQREKKVTQLRM